MLMNSDKSTTVRIDPETPILMYGGGIKLAREIKINDKLLGCNVSQITVIGIVSGENDMYDIITNNGEVLRVDPLYIMTLYDTNNKDASLYNISLVDFLQKPYAWQKAQAMVYATAEYTDRKTDTQPILAGPVCVHKFKHIPDQYMYNSKTVRIQVLRSIVKELQKKQITTYNEKNHMNSIIIYRPSHESLTHDINISIDDTLLCQQIRLLARSVGYNVLWCDNDKKLTIFGNINCTPGNGKIATLFSVKKVGLQKYCGLNIDVSGGLVLGNGLLV